MEFSAELDQIVPALFKAREAMSSGAKKNTQNGHLKNKYANLESFIAAVRPALEANGLMLMQPWEAGPEKNIIYLTTIVMHVSGQFMRVTSPFPISKMDAHGVGSAITYARRYAMASVFNIAQADDDGNGTIKTSSDVVKSIKQAENLEALKKILDAAKRPDFFGKDANAMRVINQAYNDRSGELLAGGGTFVPAPKQDASTATQPEQPAHTEQQDIQNF